VKLNVFFLNFKLQEVIEGVILNVFPYNNEEGAMILNIKGGKMPVMKIFRYDK
jgi:hypothetical protein